MHQHIRSLARGFAVVFAVSVTALLILRAQRSAGAETPASLEEPGNEIEALQTGARDDDDLHEKVRQALTPDEPKPESWHGPNPPLLYSSKSFQMVDKELSGEIEGLVFPPPSASPFPNGQHPTPSGIPPSGTLLPSSKFAPLDLLPESNEPSKVDG